MNSLSRKCAWSLLLFGGCGSVMATDAVVSSCNESAFTSAFNTVNSSGAGTITFSCSGSIVFTGYKQVSGTVVIDGGANAITFDGGGASAFFQVYASGALTLKKLNLSKGGLNGAHPVESFGLLTLDQVTATLNSVPGSVVYSSGTALIRKSTFSYNNITGAFADYAGAAVRNEGGEVSISGSTFAHNSTDNTSTGSGGAIYNNGGTLHVSGSTFTVNGSYNGGAIYSNGELHVINSTFQGNTAFSGGGAVYQSSSSNSSLDFNTVAGNSAVFGAGVYNGGAGTMTVGKSIFAGNSTGNCDGANFVSGGYNLANDTGCGGFFGVTDTSSATLPLGALANNGGPTQTMTLSAGNAAINKVPAASCKDSAGTTVRYDQRVYTRPTGSTCDSGAYQHTGISDRIFGDGFDF